jgi:hypothetical protein
MPPVLLLLFFILFFFKHYSNKDSDISMSDATWKFRIVAMFVTVDMHLQTPRRTYGVGTFMIHLPRGFTYFPKSSGPPQNSRCQESDMTHVPYWEPTNTGCRRIKFSRSGNLAPGICTTLHLQYQTAYE